MRALQIPWLAGVVLSAGAWAGSIAEHRPDQAAALLPTPIAGEVAASHPADQIGPDADSISARPPVDDPWESFNRRIHSFNNTADRFVLRPLAVGYDRALPDPAKAGVSRFLANLGTPLTAVNQALQGRPGHAAQSLGRFVTNTTIGIGGVFDPASRFGMVQRDGEDFGQTLATWGWRDSNYLVVPLLGPRTLRDALSMLGDQPFSLVGQIQDSGVAMGLRMLETVDGRARMLPIERFRRDAIDDYLFVRDAWAQRRNQRIRENDPQSAND